MTKEKYAATGFGVPLAWLAELDSLPAPNALADAFGDRYLYRHNPVFARIRDAAVDLGYRFSAEDTGLWRDYQSLSLMALHRILAEKTIPYLDTGATFGRLLAADRAARLPVGFIASNLKHNHVFHESAHGVAHSILCERNGDLRRIAPGERERFVLEAILAESFANTMEALGSICRHLPLSDWLFYSLNSYFTQDEKRHEVLAGTLPLLGAQKRFDVLFFAHFEANLAAGPPGETAFERIAAAAGCDGDQTAPAREIAGTGFQLSAGFRESTTPAYFELLGYQAEYKTLAKAEWLNTRGNREVAREMAQAFWLAAGQP